MSIDSILRMGGDASSCEELFWVVASKVGKSDGSTILTPTYTD